MGRLAANEVRFAVGSVMVGEFPPVDDAALIRRRVIRGPFGSLRSAFL